MAKVRKTWREKLADDKGLPQVKEIKGKMSTRWGTGTVVIPAPREVNEIMRSVPKGRLITINQIRVKLAKKHGASIGCPITTGIFAWVAAHAAEEDAAEGKKDITPYWRTLKVGGELNPKYPGGINAQAERLKEEGHTIEPGKDKKPPKVKDFEKALVEGE
jgi:alkylated DNA nucleotide flippase Atl1